MCAAVLQSVRVALAPVVLNSGLTISAAAVVALEHGIPLVSTPLGARGLRLNKMHGVVAVAKTAAEFAAEAVQLHSNSTRWFEQKALARNHLTQYLNFGLLQRELRRTITDLMRDVAL